MKIHRVVQMLGATTSTGKLADDMYDLNYKDYYSKAEEKYIPISHMDFQHLVRAFVKQNDEDVRTDTQEGKIRDQAKFYDDVVEKNDRIHKKNLKETISTYNTYLANAMPLESFKKINNQCEELQLENQRLVQQLEHDEHQVGKYDDLKKQTDVLVKDNSELRFQIQQVDRNQTVSKEAYDIAWDNNKTLKKQVDHWKKLAEDNFISSINDSETSDTFKNKYEELRKTYAVLLEDYNIDTGREVWKDRYVKEVEKSDFWHKAYVERCTSSTGHNYVFSEIPNDCDGQRFTDDLKQYLNKDSYKMRVRGQYLKDEVKETEGWRKYERGQPIDKSKCLRVYLDKK